MMDSPLALDWKSETVRRNCNASKPQNTFIKTFNGMCPGFFFFHTNDKLPSPWLQLLLGTILTLPVLEQSYPEFCAAFLSRRLKDHFILAPRLGHSSQASALLSGAISFPSLFILE